MELFYESEKEQAAIMEFISKWPTFKEEQLDYIPKYRENEIAWASNSTARGMCESLNGYTYADVTSAVIDEKDVSNTITINCADLKVSDLPPNCIHVSAKSTY